MSEDNGSFTWQTIGIAFIVICALVAVVSSFSGDGQKDDEKPEVDPKKKELNEKIDAWVIAEQFIKRGLKSPGTADFGSAFRDYQDPDTHATKRPDGSFFIHGWVDSQNSFGATIRAKWNIRIRLDGDTWNIIDGPEFLN